MVTLNGKTAAPKLVNDVMTNRDVMSFVGLSTDTKPTASWNDSLIANGSTFFELNTSTAYMYDEENATWHAL